MITRALLNLSTIQVVLFGSVLSRDKFAREPSNQISRIGDEVLFACKLTSQRSNVQWTRNGFGLGFGRDLLGFSRYSIIGSSAEGDWSLKISDVRLEDEGLYQCQVGGSGSSPPMKSREGNLTVYIEPDPPSVLQGGGSGVLSTGAGEWMELTCVSRNGKPPSTIDWLFMNSSTVQYDVRTRVEQMGRMFTTISTIKIKVGKELDGVVIVCQAQNRMDVTPQTTRISLDVEYPPDVKVVFDEASVREGEDLKISCLARANPSKLDYSWLINRVGIIDIQTGLPLKMSEHIIKSISRDMHGAVVTCEVANKRGRAEDSRRISVLYPPTVSISSRKEVVAENEIASIVCKADSNPPSTINWYKHPDLNKVIHTGENLTLPINRKTEGTYSCTAKPEGLEESRAEVADIIMKRKPQILNRDGSVYAILGETAHIRCTGEMIPNHGSVSWRRKGYRVGTDPDPFEVLDEKFGTEFVSTLVIPAVQQQDFGTYECFVENEIGRDGAIFHLREEGELTLASIIGSILGLIFTLLILAAAAYWRLCGYPNVSLHPWKSKSDESQAKAL